MTATSGPTAERSDGVAVSDARQVSDEDMLRASLYALISRALAKPLDADALEMLRGLEGGDTDLGQAISALAAVATRTTQSAAEEEYTVLFYGHGAGGELAPFASRYLTGFSHEKPLAELRGDMARLGIARADDLTDPEDHIAFLCEVMHGLIMGSLGGEAMGSDDTDADLAQEFFNAHIASWAVDFFADLEASKNAAFYMPVGAIGRMFIELEREAFAATE